MCHKYSWLSSWKLEPLTDVPPAEWINWQVKTEVPSCRLEELFEEKHPHGSNSAIIYSFFHRNLDFSSDWCESPVWIWCRLPVHHLLSWRFSSDFQTKAWLQTKRLHLIRAGLQICHRGPSKPAPPGPGPWLLNQSRTRARRKSWLFEQRLDVAVSGLKVPPRQS